MKKFAKVMAVALVAVMALVALVACGPASDPDKAAAALKKNDYVVTQLDANKTADKLVLKGIEVVLGIDEGSLVARVGGASSSDKITIWYFASAKAANKAWENNEEYFSSDKDDKDSNWVTGKSGKMIYAGTKQAVKDAR